ncbi:MAG: tRNA (adenosine(37)-N6)-threonylcarbamoyltransferase complex dimerization subunit type 1 TsaB [Burkholderiales bacterium]|nr:tRNA (adenosine(37)-N6)-threonylcarbamoyltransferase complex dimerization subunit type 1 TsaB [Burkholderiales bacterium]
MKLLAFDTGTQAMSIAVARTVDGQVRVWQHNAAGGAQASIGLIAAMEDLLAQAGLRLDELDAICFGAGPGSFTGLRTACSVAQGLAFGAGVPVVAVDSLLAVAEDARATALGAQPSGRVTALLDARMDEMYAATYAFEGRRWTCLQEGVLVRPEALGTLLATCAHNAATDVPWALAGNVFDEYGARFGALPAACASGARIAALPSAAAMLRLAPLLLEDGQAQDAAQALPRYIRDKVAQTTAERMAGKALAASAAAGATPENAPSTLAHTG